MKTLQLPTTQRRSLGLCYLAPASGAALVAFFLSASAVGAATLFTSATSTAGKFVDNWSTGTQFTTGSNDISVTQIGYVDWNSSDSGFGDGFVGTPQVGIWQGSHGDVSPTNITTITFPTGTDAELIGDFRYVTLNTPITLLANTTYQIMGYGFNTDPTVHFTAGSSTVDPTLGLTGFRAEAHEGGLGFGSLDGNGAWGAGNIASSASFVGTVVPEPSAALLGGLGLLALLRRRR